MAKEVLDTILSIQPKDTAGTDGETRESVVYRHAEEMLEKLPPSYPPYEVIISRNDYINISFYVIYVHIISAERYVIVWKQYLVTYATIDTNTWIAPSIYCTFIPSHTNDRQDETCQHNMWFCDAFKLH